MRACQEAGVREADEAVEAVAVGGIDLDGSAFGAVECRLDRGGFYPRMPGADDSDDMQRDVQFHPVMLSRPAGSTGRATWRSGHPGSGQSPTRPRTATALASPRTPHRP